MIGYVGEEIVLEFGIHKGLPFYNRVSYAGKNIS